MPVVSVIVAAHDAADTIGDCLDAVGRQSLERDRYEVIMVDNGSTDATAEIAARREGVIVVREPSRGAYIARNAGLRRARGRLIAFTDADCVPEPDWLERLVAALSADEARVVMGRDRPVGTGRAIRLLASYDHEKEGYVMSHANPEVYYGHTNNLITAREVLEEVGGFDPLPRGADVVFVQKVIARYGTDAVRYEGQALVHHTEIRSTRDYFRKAFIYGRSLRGYGGRVRVRALTNRERLRVFRRVVASRRLSPPAAAGFLLLLCAGVAVYGLGWLVGPRSASPVESGAATAGSPGSPGP